MTVDAPRLSEAKAALLEHYLRGELPQRAAARHGIPRRPAGERVPLSFGQQQIWLLGQMAPDRPVYNECVTIRMAGPLDPAALQRGFNEIVRRHEPWRTTFAIVDGEPSQIIHPPPDIALPVIHLEHLPENEREPEALRLATEDARAPFDLAKGPLLRARLIKLDDAEHRLYLTLHHIIFDGVSIYDVLLPELAALHDAFAIGKPSPLSEPAIQYADYAYWQRQRLQADFLAEHMPYWRQLLSNPPMLQLPTDHPRPTVQTFRGALQRIALPRTLTDGLKELSRREGVTLYMILVSTLTTLLHRYAGQDEVVIGTVTGSRDRPEIEKLMGFFLNTLVLRTDFADDPTFSELLQRVRRASLDAQAHKEVPFELVVRDLHPQRNFAQNPLFQVLFTFEPPLAPLDVPWTMSQLDLDVGTAKFDLSVELDDRPEGIIGRFEYNTDLFDEATIARMVGHFETLLEGIIADSSQRVSALPLLTPAERQALLVEWNATEADYPQEQCVHEMFAAQVAKTPDAIAAVFGHERITYHALDRRANQLAHHLRAYGVGPDTFVGIGMERSLEMLVGLLAVLKAGGAYVPLDPAYPRERLAFMLDDARVRVLLTEQHLAPKLPASGAEVICLDRDRDEIARHPTDAPPPGATPESLAYLIYTSGSTGTPKGVMIPHRALTNFLWAMRAQLGVTDHDVVMAATSLSFDIAGLELYLPLIVGARVVIVPRDVAKHGRRFAALVAASRATVMQATPTTWRMLLDAGWQGSRNLHILCGGEALPQSLAARLLGAGNRLTNLYGPTETTIWSTLHEVRHAETPIPLGRPIANTRVYILDRNRRPVPVGVPGELYIGGDSVAYGYLGRPELTAQRFITDPFVTDPAARMYATGDLVRYLADSTLDFLGRIDNQAKVRGFRIEMGEIETLLERHEGVRQAVVMARGDIPGTESLAAYIIPAREPAPTVGDLRQALATQLPDYMVPSAFVLLDAMPMTPNGKVDRRALPAPGSVQGERERSFVPPTTMLQLQLAQIWEEILNVRPVGITDDFFELGGTSLLAARLVDRITDVCEQSLPMASLFSGATIRHLEQALQMRWVEGTHSPIVRVQEGDAKQPFFFLHGDLEDGGLYSVKLARSLDPERPFYVINPFGTNGEHVAHTLEAVATDHLAVLKAAQPEGPYLLGGFCAGAWVAYEMSHQLRAQGHTVDALIMIEPGVTFVRTRIARFLINRLGDLLRLDTEARMRIFLLIRNDVKHRFLTFLRTGRAEMIASIKELLRPDARPAQPAPTPPSDDAATARAKKTEELLGRYSWATAGYKPQRYSGRVALFWATEEHPKPMRDPSMGWKAFVDDIEVHPTPGSHYAVITTNGEALARQMRRWLDTAERVGTIRNAAGDG